MNKAERAKPKFAKPRRKMFNKKDYKKTTKTKVFGITFELLQRLFASQEHQGCELS